MKNYTKKETINGTTYYYNENNQNHRTDGPAVEWANGSKEWYVDGKRHRTDGPAIEWAGGSKHWYVDGKLHRTDGPAIEDADGTKKWYVDDKLHRTDGPAVEDADGTKAWYVDGKCHRTDGPAIEYADGSKVWYVDGKELTEEEFDRKYRVNKPITSTFIPKYRFLTMKNYSTKMELGECTFYYDEEGMYHRTDGPACVYADGSESWYIHGKRHRTDGPAVKHLGLTGVFSCSYWINDAMLTEEEFNEAIKNMVEPCTDTTTCVPKYRF